MAVKSNDSNLNDLSSQIMSNMESGASRRSTKSKEELFTIAALYWAPQNKFPDGKVTGKRMVQLGYIKNEIQFGVYAKKIKEGYLEEFKKFLSDPTKVDAIMKDFETRSKQHPVSKK